ncbi:hypothetical protein ACUXST_001880 [Sphingomonas sp. F9_3S_D5_B_2]
MLHPVGDVLAPLENPVLRFHAALLLLLLLEKARLALVIVPPLLEGTRLPLLVASLLLERTRLLLLDAPPLLEDVRLALLALLERSGLPLMLAALPLLERARLTLLVTALALLEGTSLSLLTGPLSLLEGACLTLLIAALTLLKRACLALLVAPLALLERAGLTLGVLLTLGRPLGAPLTAAAVILMRGGRVPAMAASMSAVRSRRSGRRDCQRRNARNQHDLRHGGSPSSLPTARHERRSATDLFDRPVYPTRVNLIFLCCSGS